jgi:hypothetical protein
MLDIRVTGARCGEASSTQPSMSRLVGNCYVHGIMDGEAMGWNGKDEELRIV